MTGQTVEFDATKRDALRLAYDGAVTEGLDVFMHEGNEYVVGYAKYLLEYLDGVLQ